MELGALLVGLHDVAPVEIMIVVDHATAEVRLEIKGYKLDESIR